MIDNRGPYRQRFTRKTPGLLIFLLDQSQSMQRQTTLSGSPVTLAELAAFVLNNLLLSVISNAGLDISTGRVKNYCDIVILGYNDIVKPLLSPQSEPVSLSDLAENYRGIQKVEIIKFDSVEGKYVKVDKMEPFWILPETSGKTTNMAEAISVANRAVQTWLAASAQRSQSFPPMVFNITDGAHNGPGNPYVEANKLCQLFTYDGHVLLFNCHITDTTSQSLVFPNDHRQLSNLPSQDRTAAEELFMMSSVIPSTMMEPAQLTSGLRLSAGARGFMYNANGQELINFLSWGTHTQTNLPL